MDLLLSRYSNIDYIMEMPWHDGYSLLSIANKKEAEKILMLRWTIHYQDKMSFDEFKVQIKPEPISTRSREEILQEVYEIRRKITTREGEIVGDI